MRIKRARVKNYKNIKNSDWVIFEEDVTTLLGTNEAGKTSFLEAIASASHEEPYKKINLNEDVENLDPSSEKIVVKIEFKVEDRDTNDLKEILKGASKIDTVNVTKKANGERSFTVSRGNDSATEEEKLKGKKENIRALIAEKYDEIERIKSQSTQDFKNQYSNKLKNRLEKFKKDPPTATKNFQSKSETILGSLESFSPEKKNVSTVINDFQDHLQKSLSELNELVVDEDKLKKIMPQIMLYKDIDKITKTKEIPQLKDGGTFNNLLKLAGLEDPNKLSGMSRGEKVRTLDGMKNSITLEINEFWKQKKVEVDISFENDKFSVMVKDIEIDRQQTKTKVNRNFLFPKSRSEGFQWFFSFHINFKAETKERKKGAILLLDDPALHLHVKGKKDWLNSIEDISSHDQVIYTTHSPYLIRKSYPSRIRIAKDKGDKGVKITDQLHDADDMSLKPLKTALELDFGDFPLISKRTVIVEGAADYYIFNALCRYFMDNEEDIVKWEELRIFPAGGGAKTLRAAKWMESEGFSYAIVLDNDKGGRDARKLIKDEAIIDDEHFFMIDEHLDTPDSDNASYYVELEDMFDPEFYIDCVNSAYDTVEGVEDFTDIEIEEMDEEHKWLIDGSEEYEPGKKIAVRIQNIFDREDYGDFDKVEVSKEIRKRLNNNEVEEQSIERFKPILEKIREIT